VPEVKDLSAATSLDVFSVPVVVFSCFQASANELIIG
jgi:hypothetical protein